MEFYTVEIKGKAYDLPKDMPIPEKGSYISVDGFHSYVDEIAYTIEDGKLFMVRIKTKGK